MDLTRKIHNLLIKNHTTVAVAESCTGGILSGLLTCLPGSSRYFALGVVTYSNQSKEKILGIPHTLILKKGAVSIEVARRMALAARRIAKSDLGLSITGIAGPKGGSRKKPVGTIFIALAKKKKVYAQKLFLKGTRSEIRRQAASGALRLISKYSR